MTRCQMPCRNIIHCHHSQFGYFFIIYYQLYYYESPFSLLQASKLRKRQFLQRYTVITSEAMVRVRSEFSDSMFSACGINTLQPPPYVCTTHNT